MVKVATALSEEGHSISFVSSRFVSWADEADRAIVSARGSQWSWRTVDRRRTGAPLRYFYSGIRFHGAPWIFPRMRSGRWRPTFAARAPDRLFPELASATAREKR